MTDLDNVPLTGAIKELRKNFHFRLAKKRDLLVTKRDVERAIGFDDSYVQLYLERRSWFRNITRWFSSD